MSRLAISLTWNPVEIAPSRAYSYPQPITAFLRDNYSKAAVYRWAVYRDAAEPIRAYIGETENLVRRLEHYLRGDRRQRQVFRIKNELLEPSNADELRIEFQTLAFEPFFINDTPFTLESLSSEIVRKTAEWIAIASHDFLQCELYNKISNPMTRRTDKAKKLGKERQELIRREAKRMGLL